MDTVDPRLLLELTSELDTQLASADAELATKFPGERPGRQPIHTVHVSADRFTADLAPAWGTKRSQRSTPTSIPGRTSSQMTR